MPTSRIRQIGESSKSSVRRFLDQDDKWQVFGDPLNLFYGTLGGALPREGRLISGSHRREHRPPTPTVPMSAEESVESPQQARLLALAPL